PSPVIKSTFFLRHSTSQTARRTTMPEYLAPGVYVEEIDTGSKPIEGVSTSTAGMLGVTERGPVNVPILITSYGDYVRWFGERLRSALYSNGNDHHCY